MHGMLLVAAAALAVDYGYQVDAKGDVEYIIQIEPELVDALKTGEPLVSEIPPQLNNVRRVIIRVGRAPLPNQLPSPNIQGDNRLAPAPIRPNFGLNQNALGGETPDWARHPEKLLNPTDLLEAVSPWGKGVTPAIRTGPVLGDPLGRQVQPIQPIQPVQPKQGQFGQGQFGQGQLGQGQIGQGQFGQGQLGQNQLGQGQLGQGQFGQNQLGQGQLGNGIGQRPIGQGQNIGPLRRRPPPPDEVVDPTPPVQQQNGNLGQYRAPVINQPVNTAPRWNQGGVAVTGYTPPTQAPVQIRQPAPIGDSRFALQNQIAQGNRYTPPTLQSVDSGQSRSIRTPTRTVADEAPALDRKTNKHPMAEPDKPWGAFTLVTMFLFASIGLNFYLWWVAKSVYHRYRELTAELRHAVT